MSTLRTSKILPLKGENVVSVPGHVIQVVSSTLTSTASGTGTSIVDTGLTGTISECDFYNNTNFPSSSALNISGDLSSDLNIINSSFSCNYRNTSGGAVKIEDDVHVDFTECTFYGNEANSSKEQRTI